MKNNVNQMLHNERRWFTHEEAVDIVRRALDERGAHCPVSKTELREIAQRLGIPFETLRKAIERHDAEKWTVKTRLAPLRKHAAPALAPEKSPMHWRP